MKSYVAIKLGVFNRLNEAWNLYFLHTRKLKETVAGMLSQARETEAKIGSILGKPVNRLNMLELGPGQQLVQLAYFAPKNEVVGIDLDVIDQYLTFSGCIRMVRQNGWMRTAKTVLRTVAGIDSKMRSEVVSQLGLETMPKLRVLQMDATKTSFESNQFDVVYSRAVFEHLPDPGAVLTEMARVLKPGGVLLVTLHLYTSDSGCHDTRIFAGDRKELPFWAHLRKEYRHEVRPNSYLNEFSLSTWRSVFEESLPGSEVSALFDAKPEEHLELKKLRTEKQLEEFSDEELLTVTVDACWRKPLS